VKRALRERRPDVVVLIDFGAFNIRVARFCKQIGLKVCYYFPPGSWRREGNKGAELAHITDLLAVPFPWATERYNALGANAVTVGHPLVERVKAQFSRAEFADHFGMNPHAPIIGLLPGSRRQEVTHLLPTLLDSARLLAQKVPDAQFIISVAPSISQERMAEYLVAQGDLHASLGEIWHEFVQEAETKVIKPVQEVAERLSRGTQAQLVTSEGLLVPYNTLEEGRKAEEHSERVRLWGENRLPPIVLAKGVTYDIMAHSNLLWACSGTATLEAALFETPMLILYRGSKILELEYRLLGLKRKLKHIGLPNILVNRRIVPELLQDEANPQAIVELSLPLLNDVAARQAVKRDLREVRESLGGEGASRRTAQLVLDLAQNKNLSQ
jgi:lipid-A-disaccharide synthase